MSSTVKKGSRENEATQKGGKAPAAALPQAAKDPASQTKFDSSKPSEQPNPKVPQPTAEQLRLAQMINENKRDDPDLLRKIEKVVELTSCTKERAYIALHDMDNDLDRAITHLLDGDVEGDWEVSGKKRRSRQVQQSSAEEAAKTGASRGRDANRDRSRGSRTGGPPRLRGRGRGKDKENAEEGDAVGDSFRGRGGSSSRGRLTNGPGRDRPGRGGFGRGGRGGRRGPGGPPPAMDNWDTDLALSEGVANMKVDSWTDDFPSTDDWDNEEYVGALVETKVFTPSQPQAPIAEPSPLINGSVAPGASSAEQPPPATGVSYSAVASSILQQQQQQQQQQAVDMNAILQQAAANPQQQMYLSYQQASAAGKQPTQPAVGGVAAAAQQQAQKPRTLKAKVPPPSKIPSSAVEMPDDSLVSGLDVKFGTLDFGIESGGLDLSGTEVPSQSAPSIPAPSSAATASAAENLSTKMDQFSSVAPQAPAPSALPKPDASLGGFGSAVSSSSLTAPTKATSAGGSPAYPGYGSAYPAPPGMSSSNISSASQQQQPAGSYPSSAPSGVYSSSQQQQGVSSSFQTTMSQPYGTTTQLPTSYSTIYNSSAAGSSSTSSAANKLGDPSASLRVDIASSVPASSTARPAATSTAAAAAGGVSHAAKMSAAAATGLAPANSSGIPSLPPGVPMLGPGFIMGQGPALPYYAAPTAAGLQQHQVYSLEDFQYRFPQMTGFYDVNYQSPTSLGTGRDASLTSLGYPGPDAKFQRNDNNSPVPTSLSQSGGQTHGGPYINPAAAAAAAAIPPTYAYYYSGGVMPGGFQFSAPLYPVSAAASGHVVTAASGQYGKGGPSTAGVTTAQTTPSVGAGPNSATGPPSYGGYGSPYDDFSKVYGPVGVGNAVQGAKIGGVGAAVGPSTVGGAPSSVDLGVGAGFGKAHTQLGKINSYEKGPSFHTATPPPYGLTGGVGGPSPYTAQHMFIQTLAPHQSHSLMHPQLHQDSVSGPGQRSQSGSQQNKTGSKPSYTGSYWSSS